MALKAIVQDIGTIPEADRAHYVERDGAFYATVEPVEVNGRRWALEDVTGLRNALASQQRRADEAEGKIKGFGDLTPEKARKAIEDYERLSKINPESEAAKLADERFKTLSDQLTGKHKGEIEQHTAKLQKREGQLARVLKSEAIRRELLAAGAVPEDLDYLEFHAAKHVSMVEQGDELAPIVVNERGERLISMLPGSIDGMAIKELVKDVIAPRFPRHFIGEGASGSGSSAHGSANNNGGAGKRRIPRSDQAAINANWQAIARGEVEVV